jgi:DNA-binding transcriptional ArsR family regulator
VKVLLHVWPVKRYDSSMARRKDMVTLTDPRALRALAHPARQRLVSELFAGRVLTATEAAELVDLTPSAVSHHLRALEKWGLARRAKSSNDGRERPWEGTAKNLRLRSSGAPGSTLALQSLVHTQIADFTRQLEAFLARTYDGASDWPGQGMSRGELWLTKEETREVAARVEELLSEYEKGRTASRHPKGTRRMSFLWSVIPTDMDEDSG